MMPEWAQWLFGVAVVGGVLLMFLLFYVTETRSYNATEKRKKAQFEELRAGWRKRDEEQAERIKVFRELRPETARWPFHMWVHLTWLGHG
jgi:hypothetical protein